VALFGTHGKGSNATRSPSPYLETSSMPLRSEETGTEIFHWEVLNTRRGVKITRRWVLNTPWGDKKHPSMGKNHPSMDKKHPSMGVKHPSEG